MFLGSCGIGDGQPQYLLYVFPRVFPSMPFQCYGGWKCFIGIQSPGLGSSDDYVDESGSQSGFGLPIAMLIRLILMFCWQLIRLGLGIIGSRVLGYWVRCIVICRVSPSGEWWVAVRDISRGISCSLICVPFGKSILIKEDHRDCSLFFVTKTFLLVRNPVHVATFALVQFRIVKGRNAVSMYAHRYSPNRLFYWYAASISSQYVRS